MNEPQFIVGIDLGTTHCALAASPVDRAAVKLYDLPQLVAPGEVAAQPLLPSLLYLPTDGELPEGATQLPWGKADHVVGELAGRLGAKVPHRLVVSAKSWICHGGINRRAPVLPWNAPENEPQISPYGASVQYLAHLKSIWNAAHPSAPLAQQEVTITVPASFDEAARELTLDAAQEAGYGKNVRLIEEPQAAFYDFLGSQGEGTREQLAAAKLVLVVDVGGGTTDLTLLKVVEGENDTQELERIAVGGHLLLGGDNMDAALAHHVIAKANRTNLDPSEWSALLQSVRLAKEKLLGPDAPEEMVVSLQKRGSRLIAGTQSIPLTKAEVNELLLDGFIPKTGPADVPEKNKRAGLTTLGLPYATDPAIPRHVCAFLRRHIEGAQEVGAQIQDGLPRPDLVLLNGGVFHSPALVQRLSAVFSHWFGGEPITFLEHTSLSTAVACGAVHFGLARRGLGQLIAGGAARAYYVGVQGENERMQAFCVAPRGMEENTTLEVTSRVLNLVLNREVSFPLYVYTGSRVDPAGAVVDVDDELEPMAPIQTVLRDKAGTLHQNQDGTIPVTLGSELDESGALKLNLRTMELPPRRWRLQFALRGENQDDKKTESKAQEPHASKAGSQSVLPDKFYKARRLIHDMFGKEQDPAKVKGLRNELEGILGPRGEWSGHTCRAIFDVCMKHQTVRGQSAGHEIQWLRLTGWGLRPGLGILGDNDRLQDLWAIYSTGVKFPSKANFGEWWILWRRVAPGLDQAKTETIYSDTHLWLLPETSPKKGKRLTGQVEMMQMLAALEKLSPTQKVLIGETFLKNPKKFSTWLSLGRLGSRSPAHGGEHTVVDSAIASQWVKGLLELDWNKAQGAAFAATLISRMTGDANRDLDSNLREQLAARLTEAKTAKSWPEMVLRPTNLSNKDASRMLGESLPVGLRLD